MKNIYKPNWIKIALNICAFWSMFTFVTILFMIGTWMLFFDWIGLKVNYIYKISIIVIDIVIAGYIAYVFKNFINRFLSQKSILQSYFFIATLGIIGFSLMLAPLWLVLVLYTSIN